MDHFFKQLFTFLQIEEEEEEKTEIKDGFIESFKSTYNFSPDNLKLLCIQNDENDFELFAVFKMPISNTIYKYIYWANYWTIFTKYELKTRNRMPLDGVRLFENSSNLIEYVLYPYEEYNYVPFNCMIDDEVGWVDESLLTKLLHRSCDDGSNNIKVEWMNGLTFVMEIDGTYKIMLKDVCLSGFFDECCYFQMGDYCSVVYLYKNSLIVEHIGDVRSVVVVKYVG